MTRSEYQELVEFLGKRFDAINRRFDAMDRRFDAMDRRFDAMEERLSRMEIKFEEKQGQLQLLADGFQAQSSLIRGLGQRVGRLEVHRA